LLKKYNHFSLFQTVCVGIVIALQEDETRQYEVLCFDSRHGHVYIYLTERWNHVCRIWTLRCKLLSTFGERGNQLWNFS